MLRLALLVLGLAGAARAGAAPRPDAPAAGPGIPVAGVGFADPVGKRVYLPAKAGGVEAVDLETGKPLWLNKDAGRVFGAAGGSVLGYRATGNKPNEFAVVLVDAVTGKTAATSDPVALPEWADTEPAWGRQFSVTARAGKGELVVTWRAATHYAGGAAPTEEIEKAARRSAGGRVNLDPMTGRVTKVVELKAGDKALDPPAGEVPATAGGLEFRLTAGRAKPGLAADDLTPRTVSAWKGGKQVWEREILGVFNPLAVPSSAPPAAAGGALRPKAE